MRFGRPAAVRIEHCLPCEVQVGDDLRRVGPSGARSHRTLDQGGSGKPEQIPGDQDAVGQRVGLAVVIHIEPVAADREGGNDDFDGLAAPNWNDRSIVEVFLQEKRWLMMRVTPELADSVGVSIESIGNSARIVSLDAWQMKNVFEE